MTNAMERNRSASWGFLKALLHISIDLAFDVQSLESSCILSSHCQFHIHCHPLTEPVGFKAVILVLVRSWP